MLPCFKKQADEGTPLNSNTSLQGATSGLPSSVVDRVLSDPTAINDQLQGSITESQLQVIRNGYESGFQKTWIVCAALGAAATIFAIVIQPKSLDRGDEAEQKAKSKEWLAQRKAKKAGKKDMDVVEEARPDAS